MIWLQLLTQIFSQYTVQQKRLQAAPEKIKGLSVQAGIYFVGLCFFVVLTMASIIMTFCDLGHQWDSDVPTHFSGTLVASILMFILGAIVFGALVLVARAIARKKAASDAAQAEKMVDAPASQPANPLLLFGEEFLAQLIQKLK
jgi:ABC-type Fe3+ transport system permease subunit